MKSKIQEIIWPRNCLEIPTDCFSDSCLQQISGIENVVKVGNRAFSNCEIKKIVWSRGCGVIPKECFYGSKLEQITNIEHVTEICEKAFANSRLQVLDLSRTAANVIGKQAFMAIAKEAMIPPYYVSKDIWDAAFRD